MGPMTMANNRDIEEYISLPEDPELAFVEFERSERALLNSEISPQGVAYAYVQDQKCYYISRIMAFHDAHEFRFPSEPPLIRGDNEFDDNFSRFLDQVTRVTTEISIRHSRRLKPIHKILQLTDDMKRQIHFYIQNIREIVHATSLPDLKKEAIFSKINSLSDEIDRDRTKAEALTALTLEIASGVGSAAKDLEPAKKLLDSIGNIMAKAKDLAEQLGLPSPKLKPRLEPPKKQLPAPSNEGELDDDIPF
jgi:hypothetical protein